MFLALIRPVCFFKENFILTETQVEFMINSIFDLGSLTFCRKNCVLSNQILMQNHK